MEKYHLAQDVDVFGFAVETFPEGIGEAFDALQEKLPAGDNRSFYGISECTPAGIVYLATVCQKTKDEPQKYGYTPYVVEKGDYLAVTVCDWLTKTSSIKDIFTKMFTDARSDRSKPCVEIYLNDDEMLCLVKEKSSESTSLLELTAQVGPEFEKTAQDLLKLFSSFELAEINQPPQDGGWTAGQLVQHVIKVNSGFLRILNGPTVETIRKPDEQIPRIKANLLDFTFKRQAGDFVAPENKTYQKGVLVTTLEQIKSAINQVIQTTDLSQTCTGFEVPVFGFLTRLEAIHFVIYHTQRHTHQLKNILDQVTAQQTV
ncbi:DinB family protein [Adhaeribacter radiodurans]|uniref:DinB family protein n=1 Tax=Adhaeribacter radiodurans TaxID=2745197 RepID=A0A7L7L8F9_9BACT|nr:DinB family protein [Adhaeribacter radiodurans]QMU29023.1 DinB family protein [Adhaeribacter radiodurans]